MDDVELGGGGQTESSTKVVNIFCSDFGGSDNRNRLPSAVKRVIHRLHTVDRGKIPRAKQMPGFVLVLPFVVRLDSGSTVDRRCVKNPPVLIALFPGR